MARMLLAALQQVDKFYGQKTVLKDATLELRAGDRTALIGRNGSGKTTIIRLLIGAVQPDGGTVYRRSGTVAGYLAQDPEFGDRTVADACKEAFAELDELERRLSELERSGLDDPAIFEKWEGLHETYQMRGGYERRARRDMILNALNFEGSEQRLAASLSGGEKTRLALARLLMAQPELLLLDEPTNHLDLDMIQWLEAFVGRYPGAVMIVSHDRAFLDGACTTTAEVAGGTVRRFGGVPSAYVADRADQARIEEATRHNQRKELERLTAMTERMKKWAGQNEKLHRRAKAMAKRRDRFAEAVLPDPDRPERKLTFRFSCQHSGELVLRAKGISKSVDGRELFSDVAVTLRRKERVALVGPNGAGKSTFLKVLLGELPSDDPSAEVLFGADLKVGYYDQELSDVDPDNTLIAELLRLVGDREAHNLLGAFMFPFDAQHKPIRTLSGGERARLALLKLTLGEHGLLLLDEPTNHLDVPMIEALEAALQAFDGTIVVVSHDRRFIDSVCDRIWEVREGSFTAFEGDLGYYLRKRAEALSANGSQDNGEDADAARTRGAKARPSPRREGPSRWQLERAVEQLEHRITDLERQLGDLSSTLARPDDLDHAQVVDLGRQHEQLDAELLEALAEWERASAALSAKS